MFLFMKSPPVMVMLHVITNKVFGTFSDGGTYTFANSSTFNVLNFIAKQSKT